MARVLNLRGTGQRTITRLRGNSLSSSGSIMLARMPVISCTLNMRQS
jgi:hypothetical protein